MNFTALLLTTSVILIFDHQNSELCESWVSERHPHVLDMVLFIILLNYVFTNYFLCSFKSNENSWSACSVSGTIL